MASAMAILSRYTVFESVARNLIFKFLLTLASIDLGGNRDPMCVTKRSSHVSDLVRTSRWGVTIGYDRACIDRLPVYSRLQVCPEPL
jgi:hypothetical protein